MSNSIVQSLVRAAASIPQDITDTELDKYVAELLAKEAKEKEVKWKEYGLSAYLEGGIAGGSSGGPDPSLPKTNKRFLSSIIRTVDDHNSALLREQALAARMAITQLDKGSSSRDGESSARSTRRSDGSSARGEEDILQAARTGNRSKTDGRTGAMRMFGGAIGGLTSGSTARSDRNTSRRMIVAHCEGGEGSTLRPSGRGEDKSERIRSDGRDRDQDRDWEREHDPDRVTDRDRTRIHDRSLEDSKRQRRRSRSKDAHEKVQRKSNDEDGADGKKVEQSQSRRERRELEQSDEERAYRSDRAKSKRTIRKDDHDEIVGDRYRSDHPVRDQDRDRSRREGNDSSRAHHHRDGEGERRSHRDHSSEHTRKRHRSSSRDRHTKPSHPSSVAKPKPSAPDDEEPFYDPPSYLPTGTATLSIPSKMDHYFSPTYNPALDFSAVLSVPKTGLVAEVGWEGMLSVLKDRGKKRRVVEDEVEEIWREKERERDRDRSERKSHKIKRSSRSPEKERSKNKNAKRRSPSPDPDSSTESEGARRKRKRKERKRREEKDKEREAEKDGGGTKYEKKGAREWDMGKIDPF